MSDFNDKATVSGAIASFNNGADEVPVDSGTFYIAPSQSGTGTPSPSNPRPIVGYTGMTINQIGKNLLDLSNISNGDWEHTGAEYVNNVVTLSPMSIKGGANYIMTCSSSVSGFYVRFYDENDTLIADGTVSVYNATSKTFTAPANAVKYKTMWYNVGGVSPADVISKNYMIEVGSTPTQYTAYEAKTPIVDAFGRTIYGGERKTDGTLTETWGLLELAVADMNNSNENYPGWKNSGIKALYGADKGSIPTTDFFVNIGNGLGINTNGNNDICFLPYSSYGLTQTEWKTQYPNLVVQILVKLATPNEYTLSPISLSTCYGDNNVWCDTGDTELTYYKSGYGFTSVTVNRSGKNLINDTSFISGLPSTTIGASIDTITASTRYAYLNLPTGGATITISSRSDDTDLFNSILIYGYKNGALYQYTNASPGTSKTVDFSACDYIRLAIGARTAQYQVPLDLTGYGYLQAEVGSSASDYEPYSGVSKTAKLHKVIYAGEVDVIKGTAKPKNLMAYPYAAESGSTSKNIEFTFNDKGIIHLEGEHNTTGNAVFYLNNNVNLKNLASGKYVFSQDGFNFTASSDTVQLTVVYKSDDSVSKRIQLNGSTTSKSFVVGDDEYIHDVFIRISPHSVNIDVSVMLESGETKTTFAPYFEPFTFPPISMETDEGENTFYADEGDSTITYRKSAET